MSTESNQTAAVAESSTPSSASPITPLFRPLGNRVYVRREAQARTTAGGLHIPETALRPATDRGVVVAVGPGGIGPHGKHVDVSVAVDDEVLFNRQAIELDVPMSDGNREKLVIVQEHELLGYHAVGVRGTTAPKRRGRPPKAKQGDGSVIDTRLSSAKEST